MTLNLSYNNFSKKNRINNTHPSYLNRLKGKSKNEHKESFRKDFFDNYKFNIPQFYLNNENNIKGFHEIKSALNIFNIKYNYLKKILELNKSSLKVPTTNLNLKCALEDNVIFQHLDFHKSSDFNYLIKNKKIYDNLKEFRTNHNIYIKHNSNIFIKILNDKLTSKEKITITKIYNDFNKLIKSILKYKYVFGILGFRNLFTNDNEIKTKNNNIQPNKYVLIKPNMINSSNNNDNNNKLNTAIFEYTDLYKPYNISSSIIETKKNIEEHLHKLHNITLKLSQNNYSNVYDLLNIVLDQEYHLINFILYFTDINSIEKIFKQDNKIRRYIKMNIMNFSSFKDDYFIPRTKNEKDSDLFKIPQYHAKDFFKNKIIKKKN